MKASISIEGVRGCGYRKPSASGVGIYLMSDGPTRGCGRLPLALSVCKACGHGVKPSRSWTWIMPAAVFGQVEECARPAPDCATCLFGFAMLATAGLIWIGEKFYPSAGHYMHEARGRGISRKVPALPRDFVLGETVVYLAHRKAVHDFDKPDEDQKPGVFSAFIPLWVDLVIEDAEAIPSKAVSIVEKLVEKHGEESVRIIQVLREGIDTQQEVDA